jgi:predicted CopG family antitoxin
MATKTISLKIEAYERLRAAKRHEGESFSDVVLRATWPELPIRAGEWLSICRERGPTFRLEELDRIDELKRSDQPPEDKWNRR